MSRGRIIKADRVRVGAARRRSEVGRGDGAGGDGIEVTLRREGELPEALEVQCACGRSTVIECLYDAGAAEEGHLPDALG